MYNFMVEEANKCSQVGSETDVNIFEITLTVYWGSFFSETSLAFICLTGLSDRESNESFNVYYRYSNKDRFEFRPIKDDVISRKCTFRD